LNGSEKLVGAFGGKIAINGTALQACHDKCFINCEYSQASFSTAERKHRPRGDRKGHETSAHIKQTFEACIHTTLYPRWVGVFWNPCLHVVSILCKADLVFNCANCMPFNGWISL